MAIELGKTVPDFIATTTGGEVSLKALRGKNVVLYFYPKDNTPGCMTEAMDFRDHHDAFTQANAVILGVSRDSLRSHVGFKSKLELPFELISDSDEALCGLFEVIKMKKMYGKEVRSIERSTFLIDKDGILRNEWRGLKVSGHINTVLEALKTI